MGSNPSEDSPQHRPYHPDPKGTMGKVQSPNTNSSSWITRNMGPLPRIHSCSVPKGFLRTLVSSSYTARLLVTASGARNRGGMVLRHF